MAKKTSKVTGPDVSRKIFGGVLELDGAGHYPGVELLNIVFGTGVEELFPAGDKVFFKRQSHDYARKLVWWDKFEYSPDDPVLYDLQSGDALKRLLECLQLSIPSAAKKPAWERAHFFPYTRSLIHWDARTRGKNDEVRFDRKYFRGAGALAFKVLRMDQDLERLENIRSGFANLYDATKTSALERVASLLLLNGQSDQEAVEDPIEYQSVVFDDRLENVYRSGIENILSYTNLATVVRIQSVSYTHLTLPTIYPV